MVTLRNEFQAFGLKQTLQPCSLILIEAVQNNILKSSSFKFDVSLLGPIFTKYKVRA